MKANSGFTLVELMVVIVIVAILAGIGYPSYTQYLVRAKRVTAQSFVVIVANEQAHFFTQNKRYATNLTELGYGSNTVGLDKRGITSPTDPLRIYLVELSSTAPMIFTVSATPELRQADQDTVCGTFSMTHTGQRTFSGTGTKQNCW